MCVNICSMNTFTDEIQSFDGNIPKTVPKDAAKYKCVYAFIKTLLLFSK